MSNGRNVAVEMDEENYRERSAEFVAGLAAPLVAAGDYSRADAIKLAVKYLRDSREADGDNTGTLEAELDFPKPSRDVSPAQVQQIKNELMDAARDAVENI